jgi:hypothetical protein
MASVLVLGIHWSAESEGAKHLFGAAAGQQDLTLILTPDGG